MGGHAPTLTHFLQSKDFVYILEKDTKVLIGLCQFDVFEGNRLLCLLYCQQMGMNK